MCIILSASRKSAISDELLTACWVQNPDGGGVMWPSGGMVHGRKGCMTLDALRDALSTVPDGVPVVVHMRIGTSGGFGARVTHPYPVTGDLRKLHAAEWVAECGIAHNGILHGYATDDARGVSDTVAYIRDFVAPLAARKGIRRHGGLCRSNAAKTALRDTSLGSRLAVMDGAGNVRLVGAGWSEACEGVQASNRSFEWALSAPYAYEVADDDGFITVEGYEMPSTCAGCDCLRDCAIGCPLCRDVAAYYGFTDEDICDFWDVAPSDDFEGGF